MPFSALFAFVALLSVTGIYIITLKKRGLKTAILLSSIGLVAFVVIFFIFLTVALNNM
jgi:energy-converting hydrogenase Eha subunit F